MPRLVHLTRASLVRSVERAGLRGARWNVLVGGELVEVPRAVFAMPVMRDFSTTYQWLRELRLWHGERMIAVHVRLGRDEPVLVGRFGREHARTGLGGAIARTMADPLGMEIIVPRPIVAKEVMAVREITQLVGWTRTPTRDHECICVACLPRGTPQLMRRIRASYERGVLELRSTEDPFSMARNLRALATPLERARGRIPPTKILGYARSPHPEVRAAVAGLLASFRPIDVEPVLARLLADDDEGVGAEAAAALLSLLGPRRALSLVERSSSRARARFASDVVFGRDLEAAVWALERLAERADPRCYAAICEAAELVLDEDTAEPLRARLLALR